MNGRDDFLKNAVRSPVLRFAAGAAVIAGGCVSLSTALALTVIVTATVFAVSMLAHLEKGRLNRVLSPVLYTLVSVGCVFLMSLLLDNVIAYKSVLAAGIYAPLAAFDRLFVFCSEQTGYKTTGLAAKHALYDSAVFAAAALPVGVIRGLAATGRLFGGSPVMGGDAFLLPFAGFILLAFAIAGMKALFGGADSE